MLVADLEHIRLKLGSAFTVIAASALRVRDKQ